MKTTAVSVPYILIEQPAHGTRRGELVIGAEADMLSKQAAKIAARRLETERASRPPRPTGLRRPGVAARVGVGLMTTGLGISMLGIYVVQAAARGGRNPFDDSADQARNPIGALEIAGVGTALAGMAVTSLGTVMMMPTDRTAQDGLPITDHHQ